MAQGSYKQFCPVAMAAEVLCNRWTIIVLRELMSGSTRFNDLRRGAPRMSPALLSQRLKELEAAGIVERKEIADEPGVYAYTLSPSGKELEPIVEAFGRWGQRWIRSELSLQNLDAQLLMWDIRRNLDPKPLPKRRSVFHFQFIDAIAAHRVWWLIVEPHGDTDLCLIDPGHDVDLYVSTDLRTMTAIWMGYESVRAAIDAKRMTVIGDANLRGKMQTWLGLSPFAAVDRCAS